MNINDDAVLIPTNNNVIITLNTEGIDSKSGFWAADELFDYIDANGVMVYKGTVNITGAASVLKSKEVIKPGDHVMFNSMAGAHLMTPDKLQKVIPVEQLLVRLHDMNRNDNENYEPLFDRLLVEIIEDVHDGGFESSDDKLDPRTSDMTYAKVLAIGVDVDGPVKVGDTIGIEYSMGEVLRNKAVDTTEVRAMSQLYVSVIIR